MRAAMLGCLVALAVLLWPGRPVPYARAPDAGPAGGWQSHGRFAHRAGRPGALGSTLSRRRAVDPGEEVVALLDALAPALRAGLPPATALRAVGAAGDSDALASSLLAAADQGAPLGSVWRDYADHTGSPDLALVAAAWSLCDAMGSPLAPTVATVAGMVRRRRAVQRRIDVAVAGPRATMRLLIALPLVGPVLALSIGVSPAQLYARPAGLVPFVVGALLLVAGWRWSRRLIVGVVRERPDA